MLSEIFYRPVNGTTTIREDNQSCIAYSHNALVSEKTKHIDLKYHFLKDRMQHGTIKLRYLSTSDMVADMLTKQLPGFALVKHRSAILGTFRPGTLDWVNWAHAAIHPVKGWGTHFHLTTRQHLAIYIYIYILRESVKSNS
jgi:hypothetical protein